MDTKASSIVDSDSSTNISYPRNHELRLRVVIPCRNRIKNLTRCLHSIGEAMAYPGIAADQTEVMVVNDRSKPGFGERIVSAFPFVKIRLSEKPGPGAARNAALDTTDIDCFIFTDSDCIFERDLILQAQYWYCSSTAHMAQGVPWLYQLTQNPELGSLEQSLYQTMFSTYVEGNSTSMVDSRCIVIRKNYLEQFNLHPFDDYMAEAEAEERIRIGSLINDGLKIDWVPQLKVYHEDPHSLIELWRQKYRHGRGRIHLWSQVPDISFLLNRYFISPVTQGNDPSYVIPAHLAFLMGYRDALQAAHRYDHWWSNLLKALEAEFPGVTNNVREIQTAFGKN